MTGYVRQSVADILPGEEVRSEPLNAEFNRIQVAFDGSVGHTHDGTAGSGPPINLTTSVIGALPAANGGTGVTTLDALKTSLSLGTAAYTSLSDYATAAQGTKADGALQRSGGTMTGAINMGGFTLSNVGGISLDNQKITGMASPTADTDAATRKFVLDTLASVDTSSFAAHVNNKNNPHETTKAQVGLGNVDNTSDASKPVSTATQSALDLKSPLASPAFTGTPTAPTPTVSTNTTQIATTAFVQSAITNNVPVATTSDINTSTGTGFANAQTIGPILNDIRPIVGDIIDSLKISGTGSASWLECNGAIITKALYPDLFSAIGQRFVDWVNLAQSNNPISSGGQFVSFADNIVFYGPQINYSTFGVRIYYSTNDGLTFTAASSSNVQSFQISEIVKFKTGFVTLIANWNIAGSNQQFGYSTDGANWTTKFVPAQDGNISYAVGPNSILATVAGTRTIYRKQTISDDFIQLNNNLVRESNNNLALAYANGRFLYISAGGQIDISTNEGVSWSAGPSLPVQNVKVFNGIFYAFGNLSSIYRVYSSTDGVTWTLLLQLDASTVPTTFNTIYHDGQRLIIQTGTTLYALMPDSSLLKLKYNLANTNQNTHPYTPFRFSDGLTLTVSSADSTKINRYKFAPNINTEFQLPSMLGSIPSAKKYIRGKTI